MTDTGMTARWRAILKREWRVLLVFALIGLAIAYPLASAETPVSWTATQTVAVYPAPGTVVDDFKPAAMIAAAGTPAVLRATETSLGLESGVLDGTFSAKSAAADPSLVVFEVTAPTQAESVSRLEAAIVNTRDHALSPYAYAVETARLQERAYVATVAELEGRISGLDKLAESASSSDRASIAQAQALYAQQLNEYRSRVQASQRAGGLVDSAVVVLAKPESVLSSNSRLRIGLLVQGLVAGLALGVIIAAGREWWLARRDAA